MHHVKVACSHPQQLRREVRDAADARAAIAEAARLGADHGDQFGQVVHAKLRVHCQAERRNAEDGDMRKPRHGIKGRHTTCERACDPGRRALEDQRVAVRSGAMHLARTDETARAAAIVDDNGLAERLPEGLGK